MLKLTDTLLDRLYLPFLRIHLHLTEDEFSDLIAKWNEPHRSYHNISHLKNLLCLIENSEKDSFKKMILIISAFYHDSIYNPLATDNEEKSIEYFESHAVGVSARLRYEVIQNIKSTKNIKCPEENEAFWIYDNTILLEDINWMPTLYEYEKQIRAEYPEIQNKLYKEKRIEFLNSWTELNRNLISNSRFISIKLLIKFINEKY